MALIGLSGALAIGTTLLLGGSSRREKSDPENSNKIWTKGHKVKRFDIVGIEPGEAQHGNMLGQLMFLKYYEDVIDPAIHVQILMSDTYGFMNELPIRSGCPVNIEITHPSQKEPFKFDVQDEPLVITNISDHIVDNKRELYTLTCETKNAISNHTTRVWKRYIDKINLTVKDILTKVLGVKEDRIVDVEETANKLRFTGNYRRPFKVISDLCPKSIPKSSDGGEEGVDGSSGFLFWETHDGYNFSSIDTIMKEDPEFEYTMTLFKEPNNPETNFMLSDSPQWEESHDILKKLRSGAYKTANWYFNIITRQPLFAEYNYKTSVEKGQSEPANDSEEIPMLKSDFIDKYSRITLSTLDQGTFAPDEEGRDKDAEQDQANFQAQSSSRYSSLFSQILHITIPMNLSLRAGDMVNIKFPELNTEDKTGGRNTESGKYMIARLSHEFGNPDGDFTGLSLVRDSFQSK
tara:strand:- start:4805 stop:6193 length:1389 start_codon:yes stop_codon:yes gene_type:complete